MRVGFAFALSLGVLAFALGVAWAQPAPPPTPPDPPATTDAIDGGVAPALDGGEIDAAPEVPPAPAETAPSPAPAPTPAPAPAPPPVANAPVTSPTVQPTPVGSDAESEPSHDAPPETTLGFELAGGLQTRLGDSEDYGYASREPGGVVFGPGVWLSPARLWSVGLTYRRAGLGRDRSAPGDSSITVHRRLDTLWAGGRAYPWRTDSMGVYVVLQLGLSWQHANADGSRATGDFVRPAVTYACSASDGPGFALGGGVGFDVDLERNLSFITQLEATAHRHTSDGIDGCAPGSGSVSTIGASIGFAYKLDLAPKTGVASQTRQRKRRDDNLDDD
jgi:hypothetical protein